MNRKYIPAPAAPATLAPREPVTDIARGISILLILFVHCVVVFTYPEHGRALDVPAFEAGRVIAAFVMPAFFFISGMGATGLASRSLRKMLASSLRLMFLAYVTQVLAAPLLLIRDPGIDIVTFLMQVARPLLAGKDFTLVVTWYLVALAIVQFMAWLYLRKSIALKLAVVSVVVTALIITTLTGKTFFQMHTWAFGLMFFLTGRYVMRNVNISAIGASAFWVSAGGAGLLMLTYGLNQGCSFSPTDICPLSSGYPRFYIDLIDAQIGFIPYFLLAAFIGIAALISVSIYLSRTYANPTLTQPFASALARMGRHTLTLFLINGVFIALAPDMLAPIIPGLPDIWLLTFAIMAAQMALHPLLSRPVNSLLHLCSGWADDVTRYMMSPSPKRTSAANPAKLSG